MKRTKTVKVRGVGEKPLTREQRGAIPTARALGLFVLWQGKSGNTMFVYDAASGHQLGWWSPHTHRYSIRGMEGANSDRDAVLRLAARR